MSMIADTLIYLVSGRTGLRIVGPSLERIVSKETSVALGTLSNGDAEMRCATRFFSYSSGITAQVGDKKIHVRVPSKNLFFPNSSKPRKYYQQFPGMQVRFFSIDNRRDTAGGDITKGDKVGNVGGDFVKGDKAGGDIHKVEAKGNYVGRDNIQAGPFAKVNTGVMVKATGGGVILFILAIIAGGAYCYKYPESCHSLRSRINPTA